MHKILIFGGTTEGRRLWEFFCRQPVIVHISVATEYGEKILDEQMEKPTDNLEKKGIPYAPNGKILVGRQTSLEMQEQMRQENYSLVIDATHPYAQEVSQNIQEACQVTGLPYYRLSRSTNQADIGNISAKDMGNTLLFDTMEEAIAYLKGTKGNILVATGSKELAKCTGEEAFLKRLYIRVLPDAGVIEQCRALGFESRQMIAMQGPFSEELNIAMLKQWNARFLLTKASGQAGGYFEKAAAARKAGAVLVVVGQKQKETGMTESQLISAVCQRLSLPIKRQVTFVGTGMGNGTLTEEAREALLEGDVIIGAPRILQEFSNLHKPLVSLVRPEEIAAYLEEHPQYQKPVVAFSGDIGFYSGAAKLYPLLKQASIQSIPGISAPVYFLAKLGVPWQDVRLLSLHGNQRSGVPHILRHKKCCFLLGRADDVSRLCQELCDLGLGQTKIIVGERLSYPEERITQGTAAEWTDKSFDPLSVVLVINPKAGEKRYVCGIPDGAFSRLPSVPMTKREVRAIVMSYLGLEDQEILLDIGAGTGSVSIEGALWNPYGQVYAVECKKEAVSLIEENKRKFSCPNLYVIEGRAPEALRRLPSPHKVFIGGSMGSLEEIIQTVLSKNPYAHIVINSITLETLSKTLEAFDKFSIHILEITQASIAKGERAGKYHLMKGQNPVFIISGRGSGKI